MTTLNISLPKQMCDFVEKQIGQGGFSTPSEFIRALVRDEQKRQAKAKLEALLLEGLNSGEPIEVTPEYWEAKRRRLAERPKKARKT